MKEEPWQQHVLKCAADSRRWRLMTWLLAAQITQNVPSAFLSTTLSLAKAFLTRVCYTTAWSSIQGVPSRKLGVRGQDGKGYPRLFPQVILKLHWRWRCRKESLCRSARVQGGGTGALQRRARGVRVRLAGKDPWHLYPVEMSCKMEILSTAGSLGRLVKRIWLKSSGINLQKHAWYAGQAL